MATEDRPPARDGFAERLRTARERERRVDRGGHPAGGVPTGALGLGFRIGVELVAALVVGVGMGLLIDYWLGTRPWFLMLFFVLGAGAGILNVYRVVGRMGGDRTGGR